MADEHEENYLIVGGFRFSMAPDDPAHMMLTLSVTRDGPHRHFLFEAPTLDQLAKACSEAANKIRSRAS